HVEGPERSVAEAAPGARDRVGARPALPVDLAASDAQLGDRLARLRARAREERDLPPGVHRGRTVLVHAVGELAGAGDDRAVVLAIADGGRGGAWGGGEERRDRESRDRGDTPARARRVHRTLARRPRATRIAATALSSDATAPGSDTVMGSLSSRS